MARRAQLTEATATDLDDSLTIARVALDRLCFEAVESVATQLERGDASAENKLAAAFLRATKSTHLSIIQLAAGGRRAHTPELSVDVLPLARVQLERIFVALLLNDDPAKWWPQYRIHCWQAQSLEIIRDSRLFPMNKEFQAECGQRLDFALGKYADLVGATPDQRAEIRNLASSTVTSGRSGRLPVEELPSPGACESTLSKAELKAVARHCYPDYQEMCHYVHGGLGGVLHVGALRGDFPGTESQREKLQNMILHVAFPLSHIALVTTATLLAGNLVDDAEVSGQLIKAWSPNICDGTALGMHIWIDWAKTRLRALR